MTVEITIPPHCIYCPFLNNSNDNSKKCFVTSLQPGTYVCPYSHSIDDAVLNLKAWTVGYVRRSQTVKSLMKHDLSRLLNTNIFAYRLNRSSLIQPKTVLLPIPSNFPLIEMQLSPNGFVSNVQTISRIRTAGSSTAGEAALDFGVCGTSENKATMMRLPLHELMKEKLVDAFVIPSQQGARVPVLLNRLPRRGERLRECHFHVDFDNDSSVWPTDDTATVANNHQQATTTNSAFNAKNDFYLMFEPGSEIGFHSALVVFVLGSDVSSHELVVSCAFRVVVAPPDALASVNAKLLDVFSRPFVPMQLRAAFDCQALTARTAAPAWALSKIMMAFPGADLISEPLPTLSNKNSVWLWKHLNNQREWLMEESETYLSDSVSFDVYDAEILSASSKPLVFPFQSYLVINNQRVFGPFSEAHMRVLFHMHQLHGCTVSTVHQPHVHHSIPPFLQTPFPKTFGKGESQLVKIAIPGVSDNIPHIQIGDYLQLCFIGNNATIVPFHLFAAVLDLSNDFCIVNLPTSVLFSSRVCCRVVPNLSRMSMCTLALHKFCASESMFSLIEPKLAASQTPWPALPAASLALTPCHSELNSEQKSVVARFLAPDDQSVLIVTGLAGGGKTMTVVECAIQACLENAKNRVLLVAPTNAAADVCARRVYSCLQKNLQYSTAQCVDFLFRLNPPTRRQVEIQHLALLQFCLLGQTGNFLAPELDVLQKYKIIVTTTTTSGTLPFLGISSMHFSHLLIDEAVQAYECESLVAICTAPNARLLLAGDSLQLGPQVRSSKVRGFLDISLQERLLREGHVRSIQLTKNYRSHPSIVSLPNRLFYDKKALVCADRSVSEAMMPWELLRSDSDAPILFVNVNGRLERSDINGNAPSYFNPLEVLQVLKTVQALLASPKISVTTNDIGVIAPYMFQVRKIRQVLRAHGLGAIRVGDVASYQGQDESIVIVSTVETAQAFLDNESVSIERSKANKASHLSLLNNPRPFNVTITRAKSLLVVIGDAKALVKDECWLPFLLHCKEHGTLMGSPIPWPKENKEMEETEEEQQPEEEEEEEVLDFACLGSGLNVDEPIPFGSMEGPSFVWRVAL